MSAPSSLLRGLDSVGKQVTAVFSGLAGDQWNFQLTPEAMSPMVTVQHLAHCYAALMTEARGEKWDWSAPFDLGVADPEQMLRKAVEMRAEAIKMVKSSNDEEVFNLASDFILCHDSYHVGQMAMLRIHTDPEWDPYSIY